MTTDEQVAAVNDAFRILLIRAGVVAGATGRQSAWAVCEVLRCDGMQAAHTDLCDPRNCPLNTWLQAASGVPGALMGTDRVMLPLPRVAGRRRWTILPLPPVVAAAVAVIGEFGFPGLIRKGAA